MLFSIPTLKKAESGVYYVHWCVARRTKRVSTRTHDLAEAKAFLGQWLLMEKGQAQKMPVALITLADLWAVYNAKHVRVRTAVPWRVQENWRTLAPYFGPLAVTAVTQDVVDSYIEARTAGSLGRRVLPATVRKELMTLRACLNWCASPKRHIIAITDIPAFDVPARSTPRERWLTTEEIRRLLAAASTTCGKDGRLSRSEGFLWLALETAGRLTALLELTWDRVDFEVGIVHLAVPGQRVTKKRRASVPISTALRPVLERLYQERTSDFVLGESKGGIWRPVQTVARRAGLTDVSPHVLRYTAATHMARHGVSLFDIAGVLGDTMATVERIYAKHCPDRLRSAVNSISAADNFL